MLKLNLTHSHHNSNQRSRSKIVQVILSFTDKLIGFVCVIFLLEGAMVLELLVVHSHNVLSIYFDLAPNSQAQPMPMPPPHPNMPPPQSNQPASYQQPMPPPVTGKYSICFNEVVNISSLNYRKFFLDSLLVWINKK